jgi:hypothetical protein
MARLKRFAVAAVSQNVGSFGHRGVVLIAKDGEAWEVHASVCPSNRQVSQGEAVYLHCGDLLGVVSADSAWRFECPRRLSKAPRGVVAEVWKGVTNG